MTNAEQQVALQDTAARGMDADEKESGVEAGLGSRGGGPNEHWVLGKRVEMFRALLHAPGVADVDRRLAPGYAVHGDNGRRA